MNAARGCPTVAFRAGCILVLFAVGVALIDCGGNSATALGNNGNGTPPPAASNSPFWAQWGLSPQHSGMVSISAQGLTHQLADILYDPFVTKEQAEQGGDLVSHFQATLIDGDDFYMESKSGTYPSCAPPGDWINGTDCGPNRGRRGDGIDGDDLVQAIGNMGDRFVGVHGLEFALHAHPLQRLAGPGCIEKPTPVQPAKASRCIQNEG